MSELQIGLLGLGAIVVIGVLIFNKAQESRARRAAEQQFGRKHDDVLLRREGGAATADGAPASSRTAARVDESIGAQFAAALADTAPAQRVEPRWNDAVADAFPGADAPGGPAMAHALGQESGRDSAQGTLQETAQEPVSTAVTSAPALDGRIDFIAELAVGDPVLGAHVKLEAEKLPPGKNIDCDGYNETARGWEALNRDAVYERVRVGIQLSDRGGPLKSAELEAFQNGVAGMAKQLSAWVNWRGERSPLMRAAELDEFCAGVDVLIGVNVVAQTPFAETKLRGLAEANGFTREDDGAFRRRDPLEQGGGEVLSLKGVAAEGALKAVSLALDVPRVAREAAPFALLTHCAKRLAKGLDGKLVDDNGRPLDDAGLAAIQTSLAAIYARMDAAGIPAGGALARRVFS